MTPQIHCNGLVVSPTRTRNGTTIFAELVPASPLLFWSDGWFRNGRNWKEPHIRWWYEIHETGDMTKEFPEDIGMHHHQFDGGAMTLRQAIDRAQDAVEAAAEAQGVQS